MKKKIAIKASNISKCYKLYNKNIDRIKEAVSLTNKSYHSDFFALNDINFEVYKGETIGIVGVNGSGKSTLLKIITGVSTQTSGVIEVDGKISALLELGAGFNPNYTGMENIYLNGKIMGYSQEEMDDKVKAVVEFADIGDFINQPVKNYSSGMFARLAFAVAINVEPEILIVDEALSVGDVFFQNKCYKKMEELRAANTTILMVSHTLGTITQYCTRAILLNKGEMVGIGDAKTIVDDYKKLLAGKLVDKDQKAEEDTNIFGSLENVKESEIKDKMLLNNNFTEYGTMHAEIIDFGILDDTNLPNGTIVTGTDFTVYFKVKFNKDIENPIFAYTFKNIQGTEICGTNSDMEKSDVNNIKRGSVVTVTYKQKMSLQNGEYLLSLGCTEYCSDGLEVHHRLYDILSVTVIGDKATVGYFDIGSKLKLRVVENE